MSVNKLREWIADVQEYITAEEWERSCAKAQSQTVNTRLKLLQYNWLMHIYITPDKPNKCNSAISDVCIKLNQLNVKRKRAQSFTVCGNVLK